MQVTKWGNSLAVRLPKAIVDELGLSAGDNLELRVEAPGQIAVRRVDAGAEFLERMKAFRWSIPEDYQFDRDEANSR